MTAKRWRRFGPAALLVVATALAAALRLCALPLTPPGLHYDEAYYGVDALSILHGNLPVFLPDNFGREPLFSYTVALAVATLGREPWAIRLMAALAGTATVPLLGLLGKEVFRGEGEATARWGGPLAALALAVLYPHLHFSRFGVRAILVPLLSVACLLLLWRALRSRRWGDFIGAGAFLGLSQYTYQAARVLPLVAVTILIHVAIARRDLLQGQLGKLALCVLVATVVFAPLGIYFVAYPGSFSHRVEQVSILESSEAEDGVSLLVRNILRTLGMFFISGDMDPRHNLPGRPTLDPLLAALLLVGLVMSLCRIRRPRHLSLLLWWGLALAPAALGDFVPNAKRSIGAYPVTALWVALGLGTILDLTTKRARSSGGWCRWTPAALSGVIAITLVTGGVLTARDYFTVWAQGPGLFYSYDQGLVDISYHLQKLPQDAQVYLSPDLAQHPTVAFLTDGRAQAKSFDGREGLVAPLSGPVEYIIITYEDQQLLNKLEACFPDGQVTGVDRDFARKDYSLIYRVPEAALNNLEPQHVVNVSLGRVLELWGYDLQQKEVEPGQPLVLTLYWRCRGKMAENRTVFVHLLGEFNPATQGPLWAGADGQPLARTYPTSEWEPGEVILDHRHLPVPPETSPGEYELEAGMYLLETMERLPAVDRAGNRLLNDAVPLAKVWVGK